MGSNKRRSGKLAQPSMDAKRKQQIARQIAARIRAGEAPRADSSLVRLAETHLRNRAVYNERRRAVRAFATQLRTGRKKAIPADLLEAVRKHAEYRAWYNEQRRLERARGNRSRTR